MIYIRIIDGSPQPYSLYALRQDNPQVSFPAEPGADLLADYGVFPVTLAPPPELSTTQRAEQGEPELVDGAWRQTWTVSDIPAEELREALEPVSPRQARLALLSANLLDDAEAALEDLPEPQRKAALIEWEYAPTFRRDHPLIAAIGGALGLTEEQIDGLFREAATL